MTKKKTEKKPRKKATKKTTTKRRYSQRKSNEFGPLTGVAMDGLGAVTTLSLTAGMAGMIATATKK